MGKFAQRIFEVLRGKREPREQVPAEVHSLHAHHAQHLSWVLANHLPLHLASAQKCSGLPFPRHLQGGSCRPGCTVRSGGNLTRCLRSPPRTPGLCWRQEGGKQRRHACRESHLRKRHQINQADPFRSDSAPEKGAPLWGARRPSQPSTCPAACAAGSGASGSSWPGCLPWRLPRVPARP